MGRHRIPLGHNEGIFAVRAVNSAVSFSPAFFSGDHEHRLNESCVGLEHSSTRPYETGLV